MDDAIVYRLKKVKALVMDCDGVLTPGLLFANGPEEPLIQFNVRDGLGIRMLTGAGFATAVISGRKNSAMIKRGEILGIGEVVDDRLDKGDALTDLMARRGWTREQVAYMGDDLPDLSAFARCGVSCAPADAIEEVRAAADYVSLYPGGLGAVREVCELLLKAHGLWERVVAELAKLH